MERRFKLIKEYPFCGCKTGDVETVHSESKELEKYPDHWQEIFPVAFKHVNGKVYRVNEAGDYFTKDSPVCGYNTEIFKDDQVAQELYWSESDIPREKNWEVIDVHDIGDAPYSVKWLPTGEVFTVGDWVQWESYTAGWFKPEKIVRFVIREDFCSAEFESSPNRMQIKDLRKADPPTLITEDGKPFWKGDKAVWINDYGLENLEEIDTSRLALKPQVGVGYDKYFSAIEAAKDYIEAAKDYIEQNSRKYSLKEIEEVLINDGFSSGAVDKVIDKLKALDR